MERDGGMRDRVGDTREASSAAPTTSLTTRTLSNTFNVGKTIRGWHLKFPGQEEHSVEEYRQRIGERNNLARSPEQDLLNAMREMLTGMALQ